LLLSWVHSQVHHNALNRLVNPIDRASRYSAWLPNIGGLDFVGGFADAFARDGATKYLLFRVG
jgi:hypothetical protein